MGDVAFNLKVEETGIVLTLVKKGNMSYEISPEQMYNLIEAAHGLSFGQDWNNGTHAKIHKYRTKLLDTVAQIRMYDEIGGL